MLAEHVRCTVARHIFLYLRLPTHLALFIAPKLHPWRVLTASAIKSHTELTHTTLWARETGGNAQPRLKAHSGKVALTVYATLATALLLSLRPRA